MPLGRPPRSGAEKIGIIVQVSLTTKKAETVDAAKALFRAVREVQQCYYVTGGISVVVLVICGA
jgi:DNA-binding Lrp family transcriptional regulator